MLVTLLRVFISCFLTFGRYSAAGDDLPDSLNKVLHNSATLTNGVQTKPRMFEILEKLKSLPLSITKIEEVPRSRFEHLASVLMHSFSWINPFFGFLTEPVHMNDYYKKLEMYKNSRGDEEVWLTNLYRFANLSTSGLSTDLQSHLSRFENTIIPNSHHEGLFHRYSGYINDMVSGNYQSFDASVKKGWLKTLLLLNSIKKTNGDVGQSFNYFIYSSFRFSLMIMRKGYSTILQSYIIRNAFEEESINESIDLHERTYKSTAEKIVNIFKQFITGAPTTIIPCDPVHQMKNRTYLEMEKLFQGILPPEITLNSRNSAQGSCHDYKKQGTEYHPYEDIKHDGDWKCHGLMYDCFQVAKWIDICKPSTPNRRMDGFIEHFTVWSDMVREYPPRWSGNVKPCLENNKWRTSDWRYATPYTWYHNEQCGCICDDFEHPKTLRKFSREHAMSDYQNNMVVTGIRLVNISNVIHIQIQEGKLEKFGLINPSTVQWRVRNEMVNRSKDLSSTTSDDVVTLSYHKRRVNLDEFHFAPNEVVLGPMRLVWAEENEAVDLPCDLTPPTPRDTVAMVLWFKDEMGQGIPFYSYDARKNGGPVHFPITNDLGNRSIFNITNDHLASLKIRNVTILDQGLYRCRIDFFNSPTRNFQVNLTLIEQPTRPVIYDAQGREVMGVSRFFEGYDLRLTCQVSGGKPKPSVTWWKDDELLDGVIDVPEISDSNGSSSKFTVNHLFIGKVTRSLWGAKLECRAQSGPMLNPVVREVPLDIYLKPVAVKIRLHDDFILAGRPIAAVCETWGSWPAATLGWSLGGLKFRDPSVATTQRSNSTISKLALVLDREDDGKELSCTAVNHNFPGGELKQSRQLRVAYTPVVEAHLAVGYILETLREGDDLKLACNVQSNPPPLEIFWFHNDTRLEHDVTAGVLIASNTLTLRVLNLGHSGEYTCYARNRVGEGRSLPLQIHMKFAPRCQAGFKPTNIAVEIGEIVKLYCEIEALPSDTVRFSWTFNGTRGDVLPVQNSRPRNQGVTSILEYTPLVDGDYGTLACWASNSVGRQRTPCVFNIIPGKVPQAPIDCTLYNESSALEVNCIPGSDGGLPQHFLLEVRGTVVGSELFQTSHTLQTPQSDQGEAGEVPPIYRTENPRPTFQLHDLEPGFDYTLAVYAINQRGRSHPKLIRNVRIADQVGKNMEQSGGFVINGLKSFIPSGDTENMMIIIIGVGAAAAFIGIGIFIGVAVCRKRSREPERTIPDDFTTPTYVSAQRIEPRVRYSSDRRRSQRTSLYMEESRNEPDLLSQVDIDLQR